MCNWLYEHRDVCNKPKINDRCQRRDLLWLCTRSRSCGPDVSLRQLHRHNPSRHNSTNGSYKAGVSIPITIQFSEPVVVTNGGDLKLQLATGGTLRDATYVSGSTTDTLTFTYSVQAGDVSADLDYVATTSLSLGGTGLIRDLANSNAVLTLAAPGSAGSLGNAKNLVIDTIAPAVPVISLPTAAYYSTTNVSVISGTSEANAVVKVYEGATLIGTVTASGTNWSMTLATALTDGSHSITATATDAAGNDSTASVARTFIIDTSPPTAPVVTALATPTNVNTPTVSGTSEPSMTIKVYSGATLLATTTANGSGVWSVATSNLADGSYNITATATDPGPRVSPTSNSVPVLIDTVRPTITNVTSTTADGTYGSAASINVQIVFSEPVTFTVGVGQYLRLQATTGSQPAVDFSAGSGTNTISGSFTTSSGYSTPDMDYVNTSSLAGTYTDAAGNTSQKVLPTPGAAGSLGANKAIVVDAVPPTVTNITSTLANGAYGPGNIVDIQLTFSKVVNVTGTPRITLNTTPATRTVNYSSGSGTNTLTFNYTIPTGDIQADLGVTLLALNSGTIKDALLNNATLTLPSSGAAGSLDLNKDIQIAGNSVVPVISSTPATQNGFTGAAITSVDTNAQGATDLDADGQAVTYTCLYDMTNNSAMDAGGTPCASLPNTAYSFSASTGVLTWTPSAAAVTDMTAPTVYEFQIKGKDTTNLSGTTYFRVNVLKPFNTSLGYDAGTSSSYTFDSSLIDFSGGFARLQLVDMVDDDNSATGGFAAGSGEGSKWYGVGSPNYTRLDSTTNCDGRTMNCSGQVDRDWAPQYASVVAHYDFNSLSIPDWTGNAPSVNSTIKKMGSRGLSFSGSNYLQRSRAVQDEFALAFRGFYACEEHRGD
ncbi:MAG: hypothetical protein EOP07_15045 [Proteobacteria bacterium]|nr:MAG: hypothetical protein EOP07_15045 [Pseudomonadota bacterium]